ncbi:MAG: galactose mutarotase [Alphaproteobacteria bacterium]|nr:galactose mutarotase [Alphaproteobacteria bacterium]
MRLCFIAVLALAVISSAQAKIISQPWGATADDGRPANLYTLTNASGMEVKITNYGGIIVSIRVPDRDGKMADVVEGFDSLADYTSADYIAKNGHYGALIGRYANRIKGGRITLDGKTYTLDLDPYGNADQGGRMGYFRQVWQAAVKDGDEPRLVLTHTDPDGYMGYPGTVQATVTYTLRKNNTLAVDIRATTDKPTVVNIVSRNYFNLAGVGAGTIDNHVLQIFADAFTPVDDTSSATGEIRSVTGTDFDFTKPSAIGPHLKSKDPQVLHSKGIDNNFVLNGKAGTLHIAARLSDPASGRVVEVWTMQPGLQVYSGNYVHQQAAIDRHYPVHGALTLEAQHFPNSPNHPNFPSTELVPGKPFHAVTEFRFSTDKT